MYKGQKDQPRASIPASYQRDTCLYLSKSPQAFREGKRNSHVCSCNEMRFIPLDLSEGMFNDKRTF